MYRVLEEGFTNIYRHADASSVKVSLGLGSEDFVEASIQDNGRGFMVGESSRGMGLNNIEDRVQVAGGTWHISSQVAQGTTLRVSLPLRLPDRFAGN